ncbi:hypothetical protein CCR75_002228 [Bremia lactucae]|uniref:Uncharacterized protein n=1 Tax=Bremia lactucae TaxID=4779 RepID=A0A976IFW9_BRELC|nr:hypothetical protein CCR75_002228 [Bremia lactucae]
MGPRDSHQYTTGKNQYRPDKVTRRETLMREQNWSKERVPTNIRECPKCRIQDHHAKEATIKVGAAHSGGIRTAMEIELSYGQFVLVTLKMGKL